MRILRRNLNIQYGWLLSCMLQMDNIVVITENIPTFCNIFVSWMAMNTKCNELRNLLLHLDISEQDMNKKLKAEATNPWKEQKHYVGTFFERVKIFRDEADKILKQYEAGRKWNRIWMVQQLDHHLKEGQDLLSKADQLMKEGLTHNEVYTRGMRLPVEELIGSAAYEIRTKALESLMKRDCIIGIHGNCGSGKTYLMKFLHNDVLDEPEKIKAVFWAGAPQETPTCTKGIQDCVAKAMHFQLEDEDTGRRSGLLANKFKSMAPGHVVLFLDNVKEQFHPFEIGIPIGFCEAENFYCTLVFTTTSEDICKKMSCSISFKMDLLPEDDARELFLYEAGWNNQFTQKYGRRMTRMVDDVSTQCARMPLVITKIGRSMAGTENISEWNNRLNELKGILHGLHDDEAKILEQLKFCFDCIKDSTIRGCFLDSAKVLLEEHLMTRKELIRHWIQKGRIKLSRKRKHCKGVSLNSASDDQGHTIINELKRVYLLEVVESSGIEYVSMNKWVRKLAEKLPPEEE